MIINAWYMSSSPERAQLPITAISLALVTFSWFLKDAKNRVHLGIHGRPHMAASGLLYYMVTSVSYN